jgi:hypothetical protein
LGYVRKIVEVQVSEMNCNLEIRVLNVVKKQIIHAPVFKAAVGLEEVRGVKSNTEIA